MLTSLLEVTGMALIVAAVVLTFGVAAGMAAAGVALLVVGWALGGDQ